MVYCGKPSKSCGPCRAKRRKCDLIRPICSQCVRAKVECGDYLDQLDAGFRDETRQVTSRARAKASKTPQNEATSPMKPVTQTPPTVSQDTTLWENSIVQDIDNLLHSPDPYYDAYADELLAESTSSALGPFQQVEEIVRSAPSANEIWTFNDEIKLLLRNGDSPSGVWTAPTTPGFRGSWESDSDFGFNKTLTIYKPQIFADDLATSTFFQVFMPGRPGSKSAIDFIPLIYNSAPSRGVLASAIVSSGLATLARRNHDQEMSIYAKKRYSTTLKEIQAALQDPYKAKSDELLATVLLMAQLDSIINPSLESMFAHLEGAKALVKLRGLEALRTVSGMRLFGSVRAQLCLSCIIQDKPMPDFMIELSERSRGLPSAENSWAGPVSMVVMMFCNIRGRVKSGEMTDINQILSSYYSIDAELAAWELTTPEMMQHTRVPATPSAMVFSDYYYKYNDFWSAGIWQHIRCVRILCLEHIIKNLYKLASTAQDSESLDSLEVEKMSRCRLLNEVCEALIASMPYFTCMTDTSTSKLKPQASSIASEGTSILWPLYTIADCPWASADKRMFAVTQMRKISEMSANQQAAVLAKRLENGPIDSGQR